ncbi:MAG: hypothetical protein GX129_07065 [Clostridiales bacterium]|nr:hypothetical protein [Clostridiales bacterium]
MHEINLNNISVRLDDYGIYKVFQKEQLIISAYSHAETVDRRIISTRDSSLIECTSEKINNEIGSGLSLKALYKDSSELYLEIIISIYEEQFISVQAILSKKGTNASTRLITPIAMIPPTTECPEEIRTHKTRMLLVPYDNDMWARYEVVPLRPGRISNDVSVLFDPESYTGLLIGAVDFNTWKNAIECSAYDARTIDVYSGAAHAETHDICSHGAVTGEKVASSRFVIMYANDVRDSLERYANICNKVKPHLPWDEGVIFGWNSFSGLASRLSAENYETAGDFLYEELMPNSYGNDGVTYVNFDALWWRIPEDIMLKIVKKFHDRGQKVGIYAAPFAYYGSNFKADPSEPIPGFEPHTYSEILLHDEKGNILPKIDNSLPMDVTHPIWEKLMEKKLEDFVRWGFDYVKLDFLSHGGVEGVRYDKSCMTGRQALERGYSFITRRLSPEKIGRPFFISLSIAPLFPHSYGHARRISCDSFGHILDTEYELNALTYGWWQNRHLYQFTDPDHATLYKSFESPEITSIQEARSRYTSATISGTVILLSEDFGPDVGPNNSAKMHEEARTRVKAIATNPEINNIARIGKAFRPLELDGVKASEAYYLSHEGHIYLALFNFEDRKAEKKVNIRDVGLDKSIKAIELWQNKTYTIHDNMLTVELDGCDAALFEIFR